MPHTPRSYAVSRAVVIDWIEAAMLEPVAAGSSTDEHDDAWSRLRAADGILVPGGFGSRGVEGKVLASKFARESKIPYLGICLGMQVVVIDVARNCCGMTLANSAEFDDDCKTPVVIFMPEVDATKMGGTMRLGARATRFMPQPGGVLTLAQLLYGDVKLVSERHRHRYEVNPSIVEQIEGGGIIFSGKDETGERMEIVELPRCVSCFAFRCFSSLRRAKLLRADLSSFPNVFLSLSLSPFSFLQNCAPVLLRCAVPPRVQLASERAVTALPRAAACVDGTARRGDRGEDPPSPSSCCASGVRMRAFSGSVRAEYTYP